MINYACPFFFLHFAEEMEYKYRVLMGKESDAKRKRFYSSRWGYYREVLNALNN